VPAGIRRPTITFSFNPAQVVPLAHDRGLGEDARGLLERRRRDERVGRQRRLGDAEQHVLERRRLLVLAGLLVVLVQQVRALDLLALDEARVARLGDLHAAEHLPHDHLDVLVVDLHALQPVDVLHLVGDVARELLDAEEPQDVVRIRRAVDDHLALVHHLAVVHGHVLVLRDQELVGLAVEVGDDQTLLALRVLAERHRAGDLRQHARVLRRARLEQLRHARQAARDVARLRRLLRDPREHLADRHLLAVLHRDDRAQLERDVHRVIGAGEHDLVPRLVQQLDLRTHALRRARRAALGIDDHQRRKAGHVVDLLGDGHALPRRSRTSRGRRTR
jgi:hypothetical protein